MPHIAPYTPDHAPFARLAIPLAAGIAWQHCCGGSVAAGVCAAVAVVAALLAVASRPEPLARLHRYATAVAVAALMLCVGMAGYECSRPRSVLPPAGGDTMWVARIDHTPVARQHNIEARCRIVARDSAGHTLPCNRVPFLLHFEPTYSASRLRSGDLIFFAPAPERIASPELPYAFDYARYMQLKGITHRQYLRDGEWQLSLHTDRLTLADHASHLQQACVASLYRLGLSPGNAALLAAVVWGYKNDLSDDVRDYFSAAGLSHMLAVSGLHTGIIAFVLWLIFYPLRYTPLRGAQGIATLVLLWVYAYITGLSPSVIRACVMASFVGVAHLMHRRNSTLNAVFGSATLVLALSPCQLFDVGFQLSYAAVLGIVLFARYIDPAQRCGCRHEGVRYVSGLLSVSVSAQAATTLIAAYYFHYIPVWSLLANILFVPLLPLPLTGCLIAQGCEALHIPHAFVTALTDVLTLAITRGAQAIATLPGAVIADVWVTLPRLACHAVALYCVWLMLRDATLRHLPALLTAVAVLLGLHITAALLPSTPMCVVPTTYRHTTLQMTDAAHNCLVLTTDTAATLPRTGEEMRHRQRLHTRRIMPGDTLATPAMYAALPFVSYNGNLILWADDATLRYLRATRRLPVSHVIVTERYRGNIRQLCRNFAIRHIVLAAAIFPARAQQLADECRSLGIPCHNIRHDGIWSITPLP